MHKMRQKEDELAAWPHCFPFDRLSWPAPSKASRHPAVGVSAREAEACGCPRSCRVPALPLWFFALVLAGRGASVHAWGCACTVRAWPSTSPFCVGLRDAGGLRAFLSPVLARPLVCEINMASKECMEAWCPPTSRKTCAQARGGVAALRDGPQADAHSPVLARRSCPRQTLVWG